MGTRTIAVSDEVYVKLRALKRPEESFTNLLDRLSGRPSLTGLGGIFSEEQVAIIEQSVEEGRARSRARRERMVDK